MKWWMCITDRDFCSRCWTISILKRKLNSTLTRHITGKGPMNAVGGTIKNKVFREVKSGRLTVTSPEEFSNVGERLVSKIVFIYLPINEIIEEPSYVKDAPKITDTLKSITLWEKYIKIRYPLLTFTIYQEILNHCFANTTGNRKIEFCVVMMSH